MSDKLSADEALRLIALATHKAQAEIAAGMTEHIGHSGMAAVHAVTKQAKQSRTTQPTRRQRT